MQTFGIHADYLSAQDAVDCADCAFHPSGQSGAQDAEAEGPMGGDVLALVDSPCPSSPVEQLSWHDIDSTF